MLLRFIQFELRYRLQRPVTYIYFLILFLLAFGAIGIEGVNVGGQTGQVKENAPTALSLIVLILTVIPGFFISSAIMGVPVLRDFEHGTHALIFSSPIRKSDYLLGRFIGSFIVLCFIFLSIPLALMLVVHMPWLDEQRLLPFNSWHYIQPYLIFTIPNLFISGALFFAGGSLNRNMLVVFVQGVILLALYLLSSELIDQIDNKRIVAMMDPFALSTTNEVSRYWTISEQNTQLYHLTGMLLANRIFWMIIAVITLLFSYFVFSFSIVRNPLIKVRTQDSTEELTDDEYVEIPPAVKEGGYAVFSKALKSMTALYFRDIIRSVPFLTILFVGIINFFVNSSVFTEVLGTKVFPSTPLVLDLIANFQLFMFIITIFYSGELIWKERDLKMELIYDTMPIPDTISLLSKFLAMALIHFVVLISLIVVGIIFQAWHGYFNFEIGLYFKRLFLDVFTFQMLYVFLAFFIQVAINHKFLGYVLNILFFFMVPILMGLGLEHPLLRFGSGGLFNYSDMNSFGHFFQSFAWLRSYWMAFAILMFVLSILLSVRGYDLAIKTRLMLAGIRLKRPVALFMMCCLAFFVGSGFLIYYNTSVLNEFINTKEMEQKQVAYETTLGQYQDLNQPKIVDTYLEVDIFPSTRDFLAKGYYILENKSNEAIKEVHIQLRNDPEFYYDSLAFDRAAVIKESHPDYKYFIYELEEALSPGDSVKMDFHMRFITRGFKERRTNTQIVFNGTFFNNSYFPELGYSRSYELRDADARRKRGMGSRSRMLSRDDPRGYKNNILGDDAHRIGFEMILSTDTSQIAIAPGKLKRDWKVNDRAYFHYKMDQPINNFYSIVSAKYDVHRDSWIGKDGHEVSIEVFHHPPHIHNVERMAKAVKQSLDYFSEAFTPYQYDQIRIMEFPNYRSFAQSYANTIPYSEGIGFVMDIGEDDLDMVTYITSHEMAHQWWGHQVAEANVKGSAMLSESLAQYAALMVMKKHFPKEKLQEFMKYELDRYLRGRARESLKEMPLDQVENQQYIHYHKGALAMFALQDYISEDSVNKALRRYIQDWSEREDRYPTSKDLLAYFNAHTPDSMQSLITELFSKITLYENRVLFPVFEEKEGKYLVEIPVSTIKYQADSLGNETEVKLDDWIDVGIYGSGSNGKDSLIYFRKHKFNSPSTILKIEVSSQPTQAGIDPIYKLIDRNSSDNVQSVSRK